MKKVIALLALLVIACVVYSCATSCGPGPGKSSSPVTYPSGYTLEKQNDKASK